MSGKVQGLEPYVFGHILLAYKLDEVSGSTFVDDMISTGNSSVLWSELDVVYSACAINPPDCACGTVEDFIRNVTALLDLHSKPFVTRLNSNYSLEEISNDSDKSEVTFMYGRLEGNLDEFLAFASIGSEWWSAHIGIFPTVNLDNKLLVRLVNNA